ncbi:MAG: hypothetical protein MJ223_01895 [Mycoplasmoidaceae bacterium]|nr:hypothetical protein [Mycoplasmoidaceae bacterium]
MAKAKKFDDKMIDECKKEFKSFINKYIKTLPNYKAELYGDIKELK